MSLRNRRFLRKILPVVDVPSQYQTPSPELVQYRETASDQAHDTTDCLHANATKIVFGIELCASHVAETLFTQTLFTHTP